MGIKSRGVPFTSRNFFAKGKVGRLLLRPQSNKHRKRVISSETHMDWSYGWYMNNHRIMLNRWHTKHFLFRSNSQRRKKLTNKICYDILSQPALHLGEIIHTTVFLKWDALTQSWSQRSLHQSFSGFSLFLSSYRNVVIKVNSNFSRCCKEH